jgi:Bacterial virulence factor lipase N-terminal
VSRVIRCVALSAIGSAVIAAPALGAGVAPRLDLSRVTGAPFPSDRWTVSDQRQLTGLRVALPRPDCRVRPSDCQDIDVLNRLDGFNLQPRLSIPFTGAIDVSSVSSSDVFLIRLRGGDGTGSSVVGINQIVWDPASSTLHAESDKLLDQDTTYALVVTTRVRDASGDPIGADRFRQVLNFGHTKDPGLKAYRKELLDALARVRAVTGNAPSRIASLSVFTTQSATAVMEKIRRQLDAMPPSAARFDLGPAGARTVFPFPAVTSVVFDRQLHTTGPLSPTVTPAGALGVIPGSVGTLAFGSYRSPDYETAAGEIPQVGTGTGVPAVRSTNTVYFNLIIPTGVEPPGGWPVAIFGHGFGDNKNSSPFLVASTLAHAGIATIAINVVGHGFGPAGTLTVNRSDGPPVTFDAGGRAVDQNGDGVFDSTEGVNAVAPDTIVSNRDGLNQTVIDLMQLVRAIKAGIDVDGDGTPDLSSSRTYYFGQSFGGIYGTEMLGVEPNVRTGVVNVPGGAIIEIARLSPAFRPLVALALGTRTPSLLNGGFDGFTEDIPLRGQPPVTSPAPGALPIQQVIDDTEWVSQSSDPVAWAPHLRLDPLAGVRSKHVIVQFARGDQTVPNPTATALIRAGHLRHRATFFRNDLAFAADPTLPKNPHTFLTRIVGSTAFAAQIAAEAQAQIATFFASDGATTIDPDGGGGLFETPIAGPLPEDLGFIP